MSSHKDRVRWIDLSDEEKKDVLRMRNAESAKKFRQKKRVEEHRIDNLHKSNESRMDNLEQTVDQLTEKAEDPSRNLRRMETSSVSRKPSGRDSRRQDSSSLCRGATFHTSTSRDSSRPTKDHSSGRKKDHSSRGKLFHKSSKDEGRPSWFGDAF